MKREVLLGSAGLGRVTRHRRAAPRTDTQRGQWEPQRKGESEQPAAPLTHVQLPARLLLLLPLAGHPLRPRGLRPPPVLLRLLLRQVFEVGSHAARLAVGCGGGDRFP